MDENILSVGQNVVEAASAILSRWGTWTPDTRAVKEVRTTSGSVQRQGDIIRIGPNFHNWAADWVTLKLTEDDGFKVRSIEGSPFYAAEILERLALFLVSQDFKNKVEGCMSRMKKLTTALE